jgi:hypothetical protein
MLGSGRHPLSGRLNSGVRRHTRRGHVELSITDEEFDQTLTLRQSFELLCAFLKKFNARGALETDLLASWLELQPDGGTADPAQLDDFLECARAVLARGA